MVNVLSLSLIMLALVAGVASTGCTKRPNIILIMSDDQDRKLNSLDYMPALQRELIQQGVDFTNHFATVAVCCPARVSFLRGQAVHSTNITSVAFPGGNYDKFRISGEDRNYLPHWIKAAGYQAEYLGKFLNGHSVANYHINPRGWDHMDALLEPYIGDFNNVVMSQNGERPVHYPGFHSTDVVRIKSLARMEHLLDRNKPFFLAIMPFAPHTEGLEPPTPLARHIGLYSNASAPRFDNWNPPDAIQQQKSSYLKDMPGMDDWRVDQADELYRKRLEALQGVDDIIEDVVNLLQERGELNNTFIVYTTDNGYHIGAHRQPAGKTLPYIEDTNIPFIVRGPGVPKGVISNAASAHIDLAPTFLDIMGVPAEEWPELLDGRSLLSDWRNPVPEVPPEVGAAKEIINVEYWGGNRIEVPDYPYPMENNSYKSLRIVSEESAWLYVSWCTNEVELYNTTADPWEINNLARGEIQAEHQRLISRLNAILMVTKSCTRDTCRDPWSLLQPPNSTARISSLPSSMDPAFDRFYASIPKVRFGACLNYQSETNERPYYPPGAENDLGKPFRLPTDNWVSSNFSREPTVPRNALPAGGPEQRYATLADLEARRHVMTDEEIGPLYQGP
ncbi:hypothetical protein S7711_05905 [Stachybotrys chartarum IBT 7711]|uniref:Sulfatase N-terminal domain-containing protein n=1 Tax=Stachybotrys chartarum (strain CBS 109288 / IBT 7711) TaxID=1280523 RepID=A0A084B184_STACB|nr:hypothetical protein S7711_05905 [Stachybotrys chartarum IBT 7711]KFA51576.1 hypothetical protein S40293_03926 [Stachybotrys chartarum IBT 40293]KFA71310.1 hypothetical protein S40288_06721 [Stachybotrys chartarum IBT 40288]